MSNTFTQNLHSLSNISHTDPGENKSKMATNGSATGSANGSANGSPNATTDGITNGMTNGTTNGTSKGTTNGTTNKGTHATANGSSNATTNATAIRPTTTPWGTRAGIWGTGSLTTGFGSKATTRDNSASRDDNLRLGTSDTEVEGKTGSGSLVESSVSDDGPFQPWSGKHAISSRSISNTRYPEQSATPQRRSASNVGLQEPIGIGGQSIGLTASRPPAINLTTTTSTTASRSPYTSPYATSFASNVHEPPPSVYTKFQHQSGSKPDSAVGWYEGYSGDERRPSLSAQFSSRATSVSSIRDGNLPNYGANVDAQPFGRSDVSAPVSRVTPQSSRTPSVSSQSQGHTRTTSHVYNGPDQLVSPFGQFNMNDGRRPSVPNRFGGLSTGPNGGRATTWDSSVPRICMNGHSSNTSSVDRTNGLERTDSSQGRVDGFLSPQTHTSSGKIDYTAVKTDGRYLQPSTAADYNRFGQAYSGQMPARGFENLQTTQDVLGWQAMANNHSISVDRQSPALLDRALYHDPRVQHMMATQYRNIYGASYNPYALPLPLDLSCLSLFPMAVPGIENGAGLGIQGHNGGRVQSSLLSEFKSSHAKSKRFELKDIYDHIAEFCGDQHGSRFIQSKLETATSEERQRVFVEVEVEASQLMTDVFGNYVIQKFFETGDQTHKKILANKMKGQVLSLSMQMYGCRVVQKALDHVLTDQQASLISELEGHVLKCVKDQNGNHVIQKAIERCPWESTGFIVAAFHGQFQQLSVHPYGCRVIQRCLERADDPSKAMIMAELMDGMQTMISDQYGNYVVQHVVEHDEGEGRRCVLAMVSRDVEVYSKHKFASNVVEKCLERADDMWRREVMCTIANNRLRRGEGGDTVLISMIKDNFGNYVIQKLLDTLSANDYVHFLDILHPAIAHAKRSGSGKQVSSIEKKMFRYAHLRGSGSGNGNGNGSVPGAPPCNVAATPRIYTAFPLPTPSSYSAGTCVGPPPRPNLISPFVSMQATTTSPTDGRGLQQQQQQKQHRHHGQMGASMNVNGAPTPNAVGGWTAHDREQEGR